MMTVATSIPVPTDEEQRLADDDLLMEIREELDEEDNVISATVRPHNKQDLDKLNGLISDSPADVSGDLVHSTHDTTQSTADYNGKTGLNENKTSSSSVTTGSSSPSIDLVQGRLMSRSSSRQYNAQSVDSTTVNSTIVEMNETDEDDKLPVRDTVVEHEPMHRAKGSFNIKGTHDGGIEITDDPEGYSVGIIPQGLAEMTDIVNEMDWENLNSIDDDDDEEESEDEFGRTKFRGLIPLPGQSSRPNSSQDAREHLVERNRRNSADIETTPFNSARRKQKKLVFADELVQGPSRSTTKASPKSVLKKESSYPITDGFDSESPPITPIIVEPKKSRFKLERSSTDTRIAARHARPSQSFQKSLDRPVASNIKERAVPSEEPAATTENDETASEARSAPTSAEEGHQLFPNKINLAGVDLSPSDGTVKAEMVIPRLSEEQMEAIRKKRQLLGKKHKRRKSADPNYPVRSGSWDDSQPMQKPHRRPSTGENEMLAESLKASRLARAKELLKAQDDIAWANSPISPDDVRTDHSVVPVNPLAEAGRDIGTRDTTQEGMVPRDTRTVEMRSIHTSKEDAAEAHCAPSSGSGVLSPKPRKPPTPERRSSTNIDSPHIPSPLSQEIQPQSISKEVQFTTDVIKRLETLTEDNVEPDVANARPSRRKRSPRTPSRQSSIDPQVISSTRGSPPPENRQFGRLTTEEDRAVSHHMVRATTKSPPPHVALHDLKGETSKSANEAPKDDALASEPLPALSTSREGIETALRKETSVLSKQSSHGIAERTDDTAVSDQPESIDDEIEDEMHRKEIIHEYHKLRARMIGREGGFIKEEDSEIVPLDEEDAGPGKRVSRFKAARLGRSSDVQKSETS